MEQFQQLLTALAVNGTIIRKLTAMTAPCAENVFFEKSVSAAVNGVLGN